MRQSVPVVLGLIVLIITTAGCKEGTLEPELTGSIDGIVLDYESSEPLSGASVTTSPPSSAFVTDDQGRFRLDDLEAGNYTINAKKPGYHSNSVTINVRENRNTEATLFLEVQDDDETPNKSIDISITNWWNTVRGDSAVVNVEYRVRNTGRSDISEYEVYFRIHTAGEDFYHEEPGTALRVNQSNVRQFGKYIRSNPADSVLIDDFWIA